jgi:flagellar hook-basal body complex protein FliE
MINFNPSMPTSSVGPKPLQPTTEQAKPTEVGGANEFGKVLGKYLENVDSQQQASQSSIQDMLGGKGADINSVVAEVAKADMSFKLLVGVRNKVIEAYRQTMQMQI